VNHKDEWDNTPLKTAAACGYVDVVRLLLARGADVDGTGYACDPVFRVFHFVGRILSGGDHPTSTPLMSAASNNQVEAVRILLDHGADVNAETWFGSTALKIAQKTGHKELAALLKARGAKR